MGRRIVYVGLWGKITRPGLNFSNKVNHDWYRVRIRLGDSDRYYESFYEAVDEMDAYNQAQKEITEEEEEDRERKRANKTTRR